MYISLIVPTYNRAKALARTLKSIETRVFGQRDVEVLIIDNGSSDETRAASMEITESRRIRYCRYLYDDMPGLLSGRHRGAMEARGEILAFLDDDVLLATTWLEALRDAFRDPEVVLVGGPSLPKYEAAPPRWLDALWWECEGGRSCGSLSLIELGNARKQIDPCLVWGLNFSIRRKEFYEGGGFHPDCIPEALQRYQGDGETGLSLNLKAKGVSALYHPGVAVNHIISSARLTPESLERRAFYQGVCDSYTCIRREGTVPPECGKSWKDVLRPIKRKLHRRILLQRGDGKAIREGAMARGHAAGVSFHQNEVRSDPKVLDWVLRPNYFDYHLPDGWRHYCRRSR